MKLPGHANKLVTNVEAETQEFGIGNASKMIEIVRNRLYEHKVRTLVQEYMCNARDAHREAGNDKPIMVTVPTNFSPTLKVRDYGPGITPDRIKNVFVMYGNSTKDNDNMQTGGFGIGAKSAWSYTDSFTVVTYVDGTKRTYVAHIGVNKNGRLDLISTESTSEKNGTEILIAVKKDDIREFTNAVMRASFFWTVKPVIKGMVESIPKFESFDVVKHLSIIRGTLPDFLDLEDGWDSKINLSVDGIPYPVKKHIISRSPSLAKLNQLLKATVVIHVPTGVVEVGASREKIEDSEFTVRNIEVVASEIYKSLKVYLDKEFKKAKEISEFLTTYRDNHPFFNLENQNIKGYSVNGNRIENPIFDKVVLTEYHYHTSYRATTPRLKTNEVRRLELEDLSSVFTPKADDSAIVKNRRIRQTLANGAKSVFILEVKAGDAASFNSVVADLKTKVLDTALPVVPKVVKPKLQRADTEFCLHVFDGARHEYTTLASNDTHWLYVEITDSGYKGFEGEELKRLNMHIRDFRKGEIRICALADRALKMIKGDKNFELLSDWLAKYKPTKDELNAVKWGSAKNKDHVETLNKVTKHGLDDSFLKEMINEYKDMNKANNGLDSTLIVELIKKTDEFKEFTKSDEQLSELVAKKYPLINDLGQWTKNTAEVAFYLNAKYSK